MRTKLARLAGLAAAVSLTFAPLVAITPAQSSTPGTGTLTINVVDDLGQPVQAVAVVVNAGGTVSQLGGSHHPAASTITGEIPQGSYGVAVFGGWSGITCFGIQTCSLLTFSGGGTTPMIGPTPAVVMADQGSQTINVTTATPTMATSGKVGSMATAVTPASLSGFSGFYALYGYTADPTYAWLQSGVEVPGADDKSFLVPGGAYKKSIAVRVTYPTIVTYFVQNVFGTDVTPAPFTTKAVQVSKTAPTFKLTMPGKIRQGERPDALIKLNSGGKPIAGLVQLKIKGKRAVNALARGGFAEIRLPVLKPGKYKVTATYGGSDLYASASVKKSLVVKKKK